MSQLKLSQNLPGNEIILQSAFDKVPIIAQHAVSDQAKETLELVLFSPLFSSFVKDSPWLISLTGTKIR